MGTIKYFLQHPDRIVIAIVFKLRFFLSEKQYLKLLYRVHLHERLDLKHPKQFQEKIQWLKLYNHNPQYIIMVDKITAKEYVAKIIGDEYIIPTIGEWDSFEDVDFSVLPDEFVIKTNNGGGSSGVIICKDKNKLDVSSCRKKINKSLTHNIGDILCEWPYKGIKPKIFAEKLIKDKSGADLIDYKLYCFNGKAEYCQVIQGRFDEETIDFYDRRWEHQPFCGLNPLCNNSKIPIPKPAAYDKMLEIAEKLAKDISFVRVDLYYIDNKIYFGELTFYPMSGFGVFRPTEWNVILGNKIVLPN